MTIREQEDLLIAEFRDLGDWFSQYEYLLELTAQLPHMDSDMRTDSHRIPGCQSGVWLWLHRTPQNLIQVQIDSDSLILKGILCLFVILFDNRPAAEIVQHHSTLIEQTALKEQLSTDRFHGIQSVIQIIQAYASGDSWPADK